MIMYTNGNLLEANAEALVNTVNTVGVMGRGIALQFKQAYPENFRAYEAACKRGEVQPGRMLVVQTHRLTNPRYIINFPTKRHWRGKARLEDIEAGLPALIAAVRERSISSIAVPPLGCGNGGLAWGEVRPRIEAAFAELSEVRVLLYGPDSPPEPETMRVATQRPSMTPARAAVLGLIEQYALPGYRVTMLEIQKLVYFLQVAGEPLNLEFAKQQYGPYAETLHHVLQRIEGHFIRGYGYRSRDISIRLIPEALDEAQSVLAQQPATQERLQRVSELIAGYETPYGVELLSSVHWVAQEDQRARVDVQCAAERVHAWNERKRTFRTEHIALAWEQLHERQWI
jgi:O-acetyl-ADP-ribose deacetylase (regulator of RNase III)